jgi:hypothetical protein
MIGLCLHVQGCREITEDTFYLEQTHPIKSYYKKQQIFHSLTRIGVL